jgi:hypothetical protein
MERTSTQINDEIERIVARDDYLYHPELVTAVNLLRKKLQSDNEVSFIYYDCFLLLIHVPQSFTLLITFLLPIISQPTSAEKLIEARPLQCTVISLLIPKSPGSARCRYTKAIALYQQR